MNEPTKSQRGKRIYVWLIVIVLGLPLVICGGFASWWFGRKAIARAELDDRVQRLRSAGMPVDDTTLADFYHRNTNDLHVETWVMILEDLDSPAAREAAKDLPLLGVESEIPRPTESWKEQQAVEAFLNSHRQSIEHLHRVAASDRAVRFPIKFESFDTLLENQQRMRQAARVLALEHHVALHNGDSDADFQTLNSMLGTSIAMRGEPFMVSQLIGVAVHGMAIGAIQDSLDADNLDASQIDALIRRLAIFEDFQTPFRLSIAGERAIALPAFENPGQATDEAMLRRLGARPIDALFYLDWLEQLEALPTEDIDRFVEEATAVEQRISDQFAAAGPVWGFDFAMTGQIFPATEAFAKALARQVMLNRIAVLALGIEKYKLANGRLPESLDELTEVGVDASKQQPLGDRPFGYRVKDGEAVLWGFSPMPNYDAPTQNEVPKDPPPTDGDENQQNAHWVWRFK